MSKYLMQARSSESGALITWLEDALDFTGANFPGPGLPEYVAVSAALDAGGGGGSPGGSADTVQYNNGSGGFAGAAQVKVTGSGTALAFGANPAGAGSLRVSHNGVAIGGRTGGSGDAALLQWGIGLTDRLTLGSTGVSSLLLNVATSGWFDLRIHNTTQYQFFDSFADFKDNALSFGSDPATTGTVRHTNLQTVYSRNSGGTQDIRVLEMGDNLSIGDGTANGHGQLNYDVKTGGSHVVRVNETAEFEFSSTHLDAKDNYVRFGTNPAAAGVIRLSNATDIRARDVGNTTDLLLVRSDSSDNVLVGNDSGGNDTYIGAATGKTLHFRINAADEYTFNSTVADFTNNSLQFGTNPASTGTVRFANALTVYSRNSANTQNLRVLEMADNLTVGDGNSSNGHGALYVDVKLAGVVLMRSAFTDMFTFTSAQMFVANSTSVPTSDPTGGGYLYVESGALKYRGSSGTVTTLGPA